MLIKSASGVLDTREASFVPDSDVSRTTRTAFVSILRDVFRLS
jgi:hypothetical protein